MNKKLILVLGIFMLLSNIVGCKNKNITACKNAYIEKQEPVYTNTSTTDANKTAQPFEKDNSDDDSIEKTNRVIEKTNEVIEKTVDIKKEYESLEGSKKEKYETYLSTLPMDDYTSIGKAYDMFAYIAEEDKTVNDELFELFYKFYDGVRGKIFDYNSIDEYDEDDLKRNGLVVLTYEEGRYAFPEPKYLEEKCSQYVSDDIKEFIRLQSAQRELVPGFLITDGIVVIDRDELADLIVTWEKYNSKYNRINWIYDEVEKDIEFFTWLYTKINLMTYYEMANSVPSADRILKSYKRFIEVYTESKYHPLIKEYYELLINNGVQETEQTRELLKKYGVIE